jgi:para-aminobenzoate synthetase
LVDNYDSYTYNLYQRVLTVGGPRSEVVVVRNDEVAWEALEPRLVDFDNVIIGPGPGVPSDPKDFGLCARLLRWAAGVDGDDDRDNAGGGGRRGYLPVLGVCLGHQGLAWALGGRVVRAPRVAHGLLSALAHADGDGLFAGLPQGLRVVRYHSWTVDRASLPDCLAVTAWVDPEAPGSSALLALDRARSPLIMAVAHRERPLFGVQFHPESVCTEHGDALLANFARITRQRGRPRRTGSTPVLAPTPLPRACPEDEGAGGDGACPYRAVWQRLPAACFPRDPVAAFEACFGDAGRAFWLDSSRCDSPADGRFSYMGAAALRGLAALTCDLTSSTVTRWGAPDGGDDEKGGLGEVEGLGPGGFLAEIETLMEARRCAPDPSLPCGLCGGGLVGYLGYEMRRECGSLDVPPPASPGEPDAGFLVVDRFVALDHAERAVYAVALVPRADDDDDDDVHRWFDAIARSLVRLNDAPRAPADSQDALDIARESPSFRLDRDRAAYMADIGRCLGEIANGESYELCLTNKARAGPGAVSDAWAYYKRLRAASPAPYAAFVRFGPGLPTVASSSPEKFVSIDRDGLVRSKPIKGTAPRGATEADDAAIVAALRACPKTFAENLMITDLVRNDMGACCAPGTVTVPALMAVETYAAVHQVVTTVEGRLAPGRTAVDCVRATFPPGSMTGAPKLRSTEILDALERHAPRGTYSGALGYLSADGACCLSVVIRTAVIDPTDGSVSIGCGGAIVADSDPEAEFDEILLKADRLVKVTGVRRPIAGTSPLDRVLVETCRIEGASDGTCRLAPEHEDRMARSAASLAPGIDASLVRSSFRCALDEAASDRQRDRGAAVAARVRITLDVDAVPLECRWTAMPIPSHLSAVHWRTDDALRSYAKDAAPVARVSPVRVRSDDPALAHKTAARALYERAHAAAWNSDDDDDALPPEDMRETLLVNERGEVTESVRASVALPDPAGGGPPRTPPLSCGLLPGTARRRLLDEGLLVEGIVTLEDLRAAAAAGRSVLLMNAVRGVYAVALDARSFSR